jgi:hypothetical protein
MLIFSSTALVQIGAVLAAAFVGPIAENFDPRLIFFVALFVMGTNLVPVFAGWLGEISISELPARGAPEFQAYARFRNITVLTALVAIANAFMSIASDDAVAIALFAVFSLSVLLYLNYYIFSVDERVDAELKTMLLDKARDSRSDFYAVGSTVIFVQAALYVNIVGAEAFFFTARDGCPATLPQFSYVDYSTTGAIVAAAAGWAGVVLYRNYFSAFNLQSGFTLTLWLHLCVRSLRVLLPLGVYDTAPASNWPFFLAVYCVLGAVTGYMFVMPSVVLTPGDRPAGARDRRLREHGEPAELRQGRRDAARALCDWRRAGCRPTTRATTATCGSCSFRATCSRARCASRCFTFLCRGCGCDFFLR